jgi:hypothetical protein
VIDGKRDLCERVNAVWQKGNPDRSIPYILETLFSEPDIPAKLSELSIAANVAHGAC